ncbi:MAG: DEAD/DEAH box helicase [Saprospirales bacterium]|nr:DEAD/DEAH box helicase [Saprospirales bacterium]
METRHSYKYFVQVILPLALPKLYTYAVPTNLDHAIKIGCRVEVQFGKQKLYTAIIHAISQHAPTDYIPKEILAVLDEQPIVTETQISFWNWMASYYMCTLGDVMNAALPAFFKLDSETSFVKNPFNEVDILELSDDEYLIAEALNHQDEISLKDVVLILQKKSISKPLKSLLEKKIIYVKETLDEKYKPKVEIFVQLHESQYELRNTFNLVSKSEKQENLLVAYIELSKKNKSVKRAELLKKAGVSADVLKSLIKKEIFKTEEKTVDRISKSEIENLTEYELSIEQKDALSKINNFFLEKDVVLLHGITSSGKTLLYIDLIKEQIAKGKQVLYLLPEIALTAQLVQRLEKIVGNVAVYHSKFNNAERVEIWNKVLSNETKIILGARSSVFLPFKNLGLIIVDEEHDASYKQQEPAPRYQCRDAAIYLVKQYQAKIILGSATPSIESYSNAQTEKYGLVKLNTRFGEVQTPEINFISLTEANKKKKLRTELRFSCAMKYNTH